VSHKPGGRLPLLSARPAVTLATLKRAATNFAAHVNRGTMGVNSLPKTVTRQRRDCELNPGPSAPESSTLTTRLPSHRAAAVLVTIHIVEQRVHNGVLTLAQCRYLQAHCCKTRSYCNTCNYAWLALTPEQNEGQHPVINAICGDFLAADKHTRRARTHKRNRAYIRRARLSECRSSRVENGKT